MHGYVTQRFIKTSLSKPLDPQTNKQIDLVVIKMYTVDSNIYHIRSFTESHSHPSFSCALHIDIQESIISSVGVYTNEHVAVSTRAALRVGADKSVLVR